MKEVFVKPMIALATLDLLLVWLISKIVKLRSTSQTTATEDTQSSLATTACWFAVVAGVAGLSLRLYGFNRSLWLDEFGTLWAIEGSFFQMWERVNAFQGQSPFYYSLAWLFIHLFGESEITLRLLSLLLGLGTVYGVYLLGNFLEGRNTGLIAASLLWVAPSMVQASADARPYALALFTTVIMFYGFARAAQTGDRIGRWLFVVGGVGLFSAHYVLILVALGIAFGYLLFPRLRSKYPVHQFALDVGLQLLLTSWCLPHLIAFWRHRESLSWLGVTNYLVFFELIGPLIVLVLGQYASGKSGLACSFQRAVFWVLAFAIASQVGSLQLLAYLGTNLLYGRYMIVIVVPAAILASISLVRIPGRLALIPLAYWLVFVVGFFVIDFKIHGSFSQVGAQDWRKAVACLDTILRDEPGTPVLYRSGFVEEDKLIYGQRPPATLAPLRSPGQKTVQWNITQLTYGWLKPGRQAYFAETVRPVIHNARTFYYLSCAGCFDSATVRYSDALIAWIEELSPGKFQSEFIEAGRGITLIRFANRSPIPDSKPSEIMSLPLRPRSTTAGTAPILKQECS